MKNSQQGFTLLELLTIVTIISFLANTAIAVTSTAQTKAKDAIRASDLKQISTALELFYDDNGHYPIIALWTSAAPGAWNPQPTMNDVIPGLVPNYIRNIPQDPDRETTANPNLCHYIYRSNVTGSDYALLAHNCPGKIDYLAKPELIDPQRDSGPDTCAVDGVGIWSWKVSSPGGRCW